MRHHFGYILVCAALAWQSGPLYAAAVSVENAWVRVPPSLAGAAAAYMVLRNEGDEEAIISGTSSDASSTAEIHLMKEEASMMRMLPVRDITVPAHGSITLAPGTMHIMLAGLKRQLQQGQQVNLALRFKDGRMAKVKAPVLNYRPVQEPAGQLYEQAIRLVKAKDFTAAAGLFEQAAKQGSRRAQYQLALLYARGAGVQKDLVRARALLREAAMAGHPKAQFYLGQMYVFGDGGEKDNVKATMWFWLATTMGDRYARDSLRVMTGKISSAELNEAKRRAATFWSAMPHDMKVEHRMAMH